MLTGLTMDSPLIKVSCSYSFAAASIFSRICALLNPLLLFSKARAKKRKTCLCTVSLCPSSFLPSRFPLFLFQTYFAFFLYVSQEFVLLLIYYCLRQYILLYFNIFYYIY